MPKQSMDQIIIIGAGLAGLTAAIHLSKSGCNVTVIEKNTFPHHKVCGEYISNEVLPYIKWLGADVVALGCTQISTIEFSSISGAMVKARLPLGGFGISRYALDFHLYQLALANGCTFINDTVTDIQYVDGSFTVALSDTILTADIVIGAFGKRSNLDQKMSRKFIQKKSGWLAVKAHYTGNFNPEVVGLHNFDGGYCGVSKVENGLINICYLANFESFKQFKNIDNYQQQVVAANPHLAEIFDKCTRIFDAPLSIGQVSFAKKPSVEKGILMVGDSAGLIHPLCGNGMAMAIHSGKIASELVIEFTQDKISRPMLEQRYTAEWNRQFKKRIATGRLLSAILRRKRLSEILTKILVKYPAVLQYIVGRTHGKTINAPI